MTTVAAHTLGCKLNFAETSHLLDQLKGLGFSVVDFNEPADIYLINTCTVTAVAERKCRTAIHHCHRLNPSAHIAIVGCYATLEKATLQAIEGVSLVLANDEKHLLPQALCNLLQKPIDTPPDSNPFHIAYSLHDRTRAFLKIQDGCDYFCTYCAIPLARGRSQSASVSQVMQAANTIASHGIKEIVLTGVNTGTFGQHNGESLLQLLQQLDSVNSIARYRISSIEPNLITDEIIDFIANSRAFLPHFHIPLQAGSDHVLQLMHRRYSTAAYRDKILYIKQLLPDACIAADILAGFNGETEQDFDDSLQFLQSLPISYLHVFTYSRRPNTRALSIKPYLSPEVQHNRSQLLHQLSDRKLSIFHNSQLNTSHPVLWESANHNGFIYGLTDNYIRLRQPYDPSLSGTITQATVTLESIVMGEE